MVVSHFSLLGHRVRPLTKLTSVRDACRWATELPALTLHFVRLGLGSRPINPPNHEPSLAPAPVSGFSLLCKQVYMR